MESLIKYKSFLFLIIRTPLLPDPIDGLEMSGYSSFIALCIIFLLNKLIL